MPESEWLALQLLTVSYVSGNGFVSIPCPLVGTKPLSNLLLCHVSKFRIVCRSYALCCSKRSNSILPDRPKTCMNIVLKYPRLFQDPPKFPFKTGIDWASSFERKQKGGFAKGRFWRMYPLVPVGFFVPPFLFYTLIPAFASRNSGCCTLFPVFVPSFWFSGVQEHPPNHPFGSTLCEPLIHGYLYLASSVWALRSRRQEISWIVCDACFSHLLSWFLGLTISNAIDSRRPAVPAATDCTSQTEIYGSPVHTAAPPCHFLSHSC